MRQAIAALALFAVFAMPAAAMAEDIALAKNSMRLFGGPSMDFPRIGMITWGQGLKVIGCERDTGWCAVMADGQTGWVPADAMRWPDPDRAPVLKKSSPGYRLVL